MTPLLEVGDVAEIVGCSEERATELLNTGELPGVKFGRSWRVPPAALDQRLVEIALQQAAERRAKPAPTTLEIVQAAARGRSARVPPTLPS